MIQLSGVLTHLRNLELNVGMAIKFRMVTLDFPV